MHAKQSRRDGPLAKKGGDYVVRRATVNKAKPNTVADTSDHALLALLKRIKATNNPTELRSLSDEVERVIYHKQFKNA